jgi:hypothetical protein
MQSRALQIEWAVVTAHFLTFIFMMTRLRIALQVARSFALRSCRGLLLSCLRGNAFRSCARIVVEPLAHAWAYALLAHHVACI